jgi:DNA mismatch endonuclease (patch repair protein)
MNPLIRHRIMSSIQSKHTIPEINVRSALHRAGYRFRLHRADLPGSPDIVLPKHRTVVLVHGCFWHRHRGCDIPKIPSRNRKYWLRKFARNVRRDARNKADVRKLGWETFVIWECQAREPEALARRIRLLGKRLSLPSGCSRVVCSRNHREAS